MHGYKFQRILESLNELNTLKRIFIECCKKATAHPVQKKRPSKMLAETNWFHAIAQWIT